MYIYQAQLSRNGGTYVPLVLASRLTRYVDRTLAVSGHYRLRVRARDRAGNWSAWRYGATFSVGVIEDASTAIHWSTGWSVATGSSWSGATDRWATATGATATMSFYARSIGWVASLGPDRGLARVGIDGKFVGVVDLGATSESVRRLVFTRAWSVAGPHSITISVLGTVTHPRADIDAFVVMR